MNIVKINGGSASGGSAGGWVKYVTESGRDSEHSPTFPTFSTSPPSPPMLHLGFKSSPNPERCSLFESISRLFFQLHISRMDRLWLQFLKVQADGLMDQDEASSKAWGNYFFQGQLLTRLTLGTGNRARVLVTLLKRSASWRHRVSVILRSPS